MELHPGDRIHFIGIGGVSMSALAHALHDQGFAVSGSDRSDSETLAHLREAGLTIYVGHDAAHVQGADVVVWTTAIRDENPELRAARAQCRRVHRRAELLAWMLQGKQSLAVTGTHGKTTTSAMIGVMLERAGLDPTAFIGGEVCNWGSNYRLGKGPQLVFEACESDGSFLNYRGCSQIITSVEDDHLDQHKTPESLDQAFANFLALADRQGFAVWCSDYPRLARLMPHCPARKISFGLQGAPDYTAAELRLEGRQTTFQLLRGSQPAGEITLQVPGRHNVLNALAAIAAAEAWDLSFEQCRDGLAAFSSTGRRFELLAQCDGLAVYDDYAHHPTEVRATLAAAKEFGARRLIAIFQPHLYSRTLNLLDEFAAAFDDADLTFINDIYAAREDPVPGVSGDTLASRITELHPGKPVQYLPTRADVVREVSAVAQPGDLILTIGAGDIRVAGEELAQRLCGGRA